MYSRIVSILFYMFFTCVIFNPRVNGFTIYFYLFVPFLDPSFLRFLTSTARSWSGPLLVAVAVSLLGSPSVAVRVVSIAICIGYLMYTMGRHICYLHHWMAINVAFAIVQFGLYYVDKGLAAQLGPTLLARTIWGQYATATYSNFYEIFYFARASGFSREAGFFSSLLVSSLIAHLLTEKVNKRIVAMYCVGLFICFSKSSLFIFIFLALFPFRQKLRLIHPLLVLTVFIGVVGLTGLYLESHTFFGSTTFSHRLGGYPFMLQEKLEDLLGGVTAEYVRSHYMYMPSFRLIEYELSSGVPFAGLPANVAEMGLFSALLLFGVVAFTASDGFVMLLLLLLTSTVSLTTVSSFVCIAYLILYWPRFAAFRAKRTWFMQERFVLSPLGRSDFRRKKTIRFASAPWKRKVLVVTGPAPRSGKTFVAVNLAGINTAAGKRVLLMDGDLRRGRIGFLFGLSGRTGLAQVLDGQVDVDRVIRSVGTSGGLDVIPAGDLLTDPVQLLANGRLAQLLRQLAPRYDLIIIDTPAMLLANDACLAAPLAGSTVLVADSGPRVERELDETVKQLDRIGANTIGVILNAMPGPSEEPTRTYVGRVAARRRRASMPF
ncbi:exopolysaccharide biosynthesis-like tyrosine-protein kinase [Caballeronia arvi]|uniref:non-specific protein-tyrosine kinase n=1 Tax=Caballeronia arvi TaxID=1777135 RepID=A0A158KMA8_9BURK|nr:CpsD/CapB family tyrosine-protein kinase [Caballeronia arvi]SAL82267.1 exopolysaccharide biosynthesis-like tyrosine-protein kinase [Caballeronia arvi]